MNATSPAQLVRGLISPASMNGCLDPFRVKQFAKAHPFRLVWTLQSRLLEMAARHTCRPFVEVAAATALHLRNDRGHELPDTAVTSRQLELLELALAHSQALPGSVVEVGSYRGATTTRLAALTSKAVWAVDPFFGYGGSDHDYRLFNAAISAFPNVEHIRKRSGLAARDFDNPISLVFIDAIHDFSNSWFDFSAWSTKVVPGGYVAMHDVDEHPGVRKTCHLIRHLPDYSIWAYAPNLAIFRKAVTKS